MPRVLESLPDALLAIAGEGPFERERRPLVDRLGLTKSVQFCGGIPYEDLPDVYSSADVVAMPSRNEPPAVEGFGIVFLEANACERPVIGAATGGIPEDRKSTRLNSSHVAISYAVFCLKKKKIVDYHGE